jgi:hypothetical protein
MGFVSEDTSFDAGRPGSIPSSHFFFCGSFVLLRFASLRLYFIEQQDACPATVASLIPTVLASNLHPCWHMNQVNAGRRFIDVLTTGPPASSEHFPDVLFFNP